MSRTVRLLYPDYQGGGLDAYYLGARLLAQILPENERQPVLEVRIDAPGTRRYEVTDGIYAKEEVIANIGQAGKLLREADPDKVVTIGGDCLVSLAPFDFLHGKYGDLGILWIDAHPDVSTAKDGYPNAHAMVLGSLLGCGEPALSGLMENASFRADQILYVGLQGLHDYQEKFLRDLQVDFKVQTEAFVSDEEIGRFAKRFGRVLVHLDVDVLDASLFHDTYFADKELVGDGSGSGRMTFERLASVLKCIGEHSDVVGFTIAEYLPFSAQRLHELLRDVPLFTE